MAYSLRDVTPQDLVHSDYITRSLLLFNHRLKSFSVDSPFCVEQGFLVNVFLDHLNDVDNFRAALNVDYLDVIISRIWSHTAMKDLFSGINLRRQLQYRSQPPSTAHFSR